MAETTLCSRLEALESRSTLPTSRDIRISEQATGRWAGLLRCSLQAPLPMSPVLALEVGGMKVWGDYPYMNAAYLGGANNLRGVPDDRYAGDAMVFAKSELRITLAALSSVLPGQFGVHGMADVGRVYLEGEDSNLWHWAYGGGLWFSFLRQHTPLISVTMATSDESTRVLVGLGFSF